MYYMDHVALGNYVNQDWPLKQEEKKEKKGCKYEFQCNLLKRAKIKTMNDWMIATKEITIVKYD